MNKKESFVYLWYDKRDRRYYLGYHGVSKKAYICSSEYMLKEYNERPDDFSRKILKYGTIKEMVDLEIRLLKTREHHFGKRYYNLHANWPNITQTEETKEKIRKKATGRLHTEESKRKISLAHKGRPFSEAHKAAMRKPKSEAGKANMRKARADTSGKNNGMYGKKHTEESRRKMVENHPHLSRPHTEESKRKLSLALKGRIPWNKGLRRVV